MRSRRPAGFTLIELMVAVTILAILVAIISTIFHQSTVAWNSGTQRMEANVTARAVLNFMASELVHAVAGEEFEMLVDTRDILMPVYGSSQIGFWTLYNTNSPTKRVARRIYYYRDASEDSIVREEWTLNEWGDYGEAISNALQRAPDSSVVLARNVEELLFHGWPSRGSGDGYAQAKTNLPRGVNIRLVLTREDDISNVEAWSAGPDGRTNPDDPDDPVNEDNIGSW